MTHSPQNEYGAADDAHWRSEQPSPRPLSESLQCLFCPRLSPGRCFSRGRPEAMFVHSRPSFRVGTSRHYRGKHSAEIPGPPPLMYQNREPRENTTRLFSAFRIGRSLHALRAGLRSASKVHRVVIEMVLLRLLAPALTIWIGASFRFFSLSTRFTSPRVAH